MKTTPSVICKSARSGKSLHPVSVLVKKKKNRGSRPKKVVRFNMKVQFSSSEEMLYPGCVEFCKQGLCGNGYELKSQSSMDVAGCSNISLGDKSTGSFTYLINPSQYRCQTPYKPWNFDSVRSNTTAGCSKQRFLQSLLRHGLLRKVHIASEKNKGNVQNYKNSLKEKHQSLTAVNQLWPSDNISSVAPKGAFSECCASEINCSRGEDIYFKWTQPLHVLRPLQSSTIASQADAPEIKTFNDLTDCIEGLRICSHSAGEPVNSEMDLTTTNTSQTKSSSTREGQLVYDLSKNTLSTEVSSSLGSFVELDKSEEEQNIWPGMPCYDMNNNAGEKSDDCQKTNRDPKVDQRPHSSHLEVGSQRAVVNLGLNGESQSLERKHKNNCTEFTHPFVGCSSVFESNATNSSNSNSSHLHSNSSPNVSICSQRDSLISKDLISKSEKNLSGKSEDVSLGKNGHKAPVSNLNDAINLCHTCPIPQESKRMPPVKKPSISRGDKMAVDFSSHGRVVSKLSSLKTEEKCQESINLSNDILYPCSILNCGMYFTDQQLLQEHLAQTQHSSCNPMATIVNGIIPNITKFLCPLCGHMFQDENTCLEHMLEQNHSRLMSPVPFCVFACPQCLCFFSTFSLTLQHMNDLCHHSTAFTFDGDTKHPNEATPLPVPYRLLVELIRRCEQVSYVLFCKDCQEDITSAVEIRAHVMNKHFLISKSCESVVDIFSSLITDQACAECHQLIYSGIPSLKLCIHTDCPLQGPVLTSRAHSLREFILRCGITDINVATEDNFELTTHSSSSITCTVSCTEISRRSSLEAVNCSTSHISSAGTKSARDVGMKKQVLTESSKSCSSTFIYSSSREAKMSVPTSEFSVFSQNKEILPLNMNSANLSELTKDISSMNSDEINENLKGKRWGTEISTVGISLKGKSKKSSSVQEGTSANVYVNKSMCSCKTTEKANFSVHSASSSTASAYEHGVASCSSFKNVTSNKCHDCLTIRSDCSVSLSDEVSNIDCCALDEECESGGSSNLSSGSSGGSCDNVKNERNTDDEASNQSLLNIINEAEAASYCSGIESSSKINLENESGLRERESGGTSKDRKFERCPFNCLERSFDLRSSSFEIQDTVNPFTFSCPLSYHSYVSRRKVEAKWDELQSFSGLSFCCSDQKCCKWVERSVQVEMEPEYIPIKVDKQTSYSVGLDSSNCSFQNCVSENSYSLGDTIDSHELFKPVIVKPALKAKTSIDKLAVEKNTMTVTRNTNPGLKRRCTSNQSGTCKKTRKTPNRPDKRIYRHNYDTLKHQSSPYVKNAKRDLTKINSGLSGSNRPKIQDRRKSNLICENSQGPIAFKLRSKECHEDCSSRHNSCPLEEESAFIIDDSYRRRTGDSLLNSVKYPECKESKFIKTQLSDNEHLKKSDRFMISEDVIPVPVKERNTNTLTTAENSVFVGNFVQGLSLPESEIGSIHEADKCQQKDEQSQLEGLAWRKNVDESEVDEYIVNKDEIDRFFIVDVSPTLEESCYIVDGETNIWNEPRSCNVNKVSKTINPDQNFSHTEEEEIVISDSDDNCYIIVNHTEKKASDLEKNCCIAETLLHVQNKQDCGKKRQVEPETKEASPFKESQTEKGKVENITSLDSVPSCSQKPVDALVRPWDGFYPAAPLVSTFCDDDYLLQISDSDRFTIASSQDADKTVIPIREEMSEQASLKVALPHVKKRVLRKLKATAKKKRNRSIIRSTFTHKATKGNQICSKRGKLKSVGINGNSYQKVTSKNESERQEFSVSQPAQNKIIYLPQLASSSLMLSLDGPACSTGTRSRLCKQQSVPVVPRYVKLKKLVSPKVNYLGTMKRIIFADLENFMMFKYYQGWLPPLSYVWGFISARPNSPFHLEDYFCKFPLYESLKASGCVHISTEIGTSKDAVDFAMTLAIAKLDDRLPPSIPFFIVSNDKGFLEVENQMRSSHRMVKVVAPKSNIITCHSFI